MRRRRWPQDVADQILTKSRRICAFCFYFAGDSGVKLRGHIAHVDRDPSNAAVENGAYLCKEHHDEYDIVSTQSKRLNPAELIAARAGVHEFLQSGGWPSSKGTLLRGSRQSKRRGVSLAVYERRLPIYKVTIEFIRYVVRDLQPGYPEIIKFGRDTEEALFLFDKEIASYLLNISSRAVRMHAVVKMREAAAVGRANVENFESFLNEETALAGWFVEQYEVARTVFAPFLRLE